MENLLTVAFEASDAGRNLHRRYEVAVGRDLLDDWTVTVRCGRIGQAGQEQRYGGRTAEDMRKVVRDRLRRRLTAPKRIGCLYRLSTIDSAPGFDSAAWLPGDLMARFFASP